MLSLQFATCKKSVELNVAVHYLEHFIFLLPLFAKFVVQLWYMNL